MVEIVFVNDIINPQPTPLIMPTLSQSARNDKQEHPLVCPHCAASCIIRYGKYLRRCPNDGELIGVQRYRCKSPDCPWRTFSLLRYPFLPIVRHCYQTLLFYHCLCHVQHQNQAAIARKLKVTRGVVRRLGIFSQRFTAWFNGEKQIGDWGPDPQNNDAALWADFTRDFSQSFYPSRWLKAVPTQNIPI